MATPTIARPTICAGFLFTRTRHHGVIRAHPYHYLPLNGQQHEPPDATIGKYSPRMRRVIEATLSSDPVTLFTKDVNVGIGTMRGVNDGKPVVWIKVTPLGGGKDMLIPLTPECAGSVGNMLSQAQRQLER